MKKIVSFILGFMCAFSMTACLNTSTGDNDMTLPDDIAKLQRQVNADLDALDDYGFSYSQLVGTDALGREVTPISGINESRYVGIFYCEWMGFHTKDIFDISELNAEYPDMATSPLWNVSGEYYNSDLSPNGAFHYWSEPLYGYYDSGDPWVIKKHLEILSACGIDYILLDNTNAYTYDDTTRTILKTVLEMQKAERKPPRVSFLLPNDEGDSGKGGSVGTLEKLYSLWLSDAEYADCFFYADEEMNPAQKPMVVGRFANAVKSGKISAETANSLWLKEMQWPTTNASQKDSDSVPWMDWVYPQTDHNGVMSVSVAQHIGGTWSSEASRYMNQGTVFSARGWTEDTPFDMTDPHGRNEDNVLAGSNFQNQWNNALKSDLRMVVVTGFNEWIAQKLSNNYGNIPSPSYRAGVDHAVFVDLYDMAYSRDVEMMKGGYGDNYLMQLAVNVRKFKGVAADKITNVYKSVAASIDISDFSAWDAVTHKYTDFGYDCTARNYHSVDPDIIYTDNTNRNNIDYIKLANDSDHLYVLVSAKEDITAHNGTDENWMNVYIAEGNAAKYDFVLNRNPEDGTTSVHKVSADKSLTLAGSAEYALNGNMICFKVPLSVLGYDANTDIAVKVADNLVNVLDTDDFYVSGDCAPIGRLNFAYKIV